ncbi:kelch repeat-containing protein [Hymenobacter cellulosilyticus]|uniref:T9SS type A sorting domain-containing protein n=1 Tax=Hymenobacter cellulosilyticus TaxID=2932248 RepID=A0A8T9Q762_9BACT|nr:kelch repeat-containing protein [Hymenobacter cellulosilyticus]UOQ72782.1 T9SS type A sorting domain-containing protein [Hymenobacter cellulosilyticus]
MRLLLPAVAVATLAGSLSASAQAPQRVTLPANTIGSGSGAAARSSALSAWTSLAKMPQEQYNGGSAYLDGKVYVFGGSLQTRTGREYTDKLQVYDIATNTWSTKASMLRPLASNGGVAKDGLIYNIGGVYLGYNSPIPSSSMTYNPATDTWAASTLPNYPRATSGNQSIILGEWLGPDGKIYVYEDRAGISVFDPATNAWLNDVIIPPNSGGPLNGYYSDRSMAAIAFDANGLLHAFGGGKEDMAYYYRDAVTTHSVYNPATRVWTSAAPLPKAKLYASVVLGPDGNMYVLGGGASSTNFVPDVQIYNPTTNTWTVGPSLPAGNGYTFVQGNDIYVVTSTATYKATITISGITWTGAVSSSWTDAGNWSGGTVPTATDDVTIPAGLSRYPSISTSTPTAKQVTLASGAQLSIAEGGTLSLMGNFVNNGAFSATGSGTLAFSGSTVQVLGGTAPTTLQNLTVGPAGASLAGPVTVQRLLTLTGNLATNAQPFVLASSSAGTAMVVNSGGVVTGATTVQRYIDAASNAGFGYRHYSPAVLGATLANLNIGTTPQATTAPGPLQINASYNFAAEPSLVTPFPTVLAYDQSRVGAVAGSDGFNQGWVSPSAASQSLVAGRGLTINEPAGNFFEVTGSTLTSASVGVSGLTRSSQAEAGWHLLGNPYPSPIDWNRVSRTNIDAAAYVYRSLSRYEGGYTAYVNGVGTNIIPQGQAFFVRVSSVGAFGSVAFSDASRETTYSAPGYARPAGTETRPLVQLTLQRQGATGTASQDEFYVYEQAGATAGFDAAYDAVKVQLNGGQQPSLYQVVGSEGLAIQGLPTGSAPRSLSLGVHAAVAGTYSFSAAQILNLSATEPVWLEDKLSGTWHNLREGAYSVALSQGLSTTRFVLHLHQAAILANAKARTWQGELQLYPNPASAAAPLTLVANGVSGSWVELVLLNNIGQAVWQQQLPVGGQELRTTVPVAGLTPGVYTVQVRSQAGVLTHKLVIQ